MNTFLLRILVLVLLFGIVGCQTPKIGALVGKQSTQALPQQVQKVQKAEEPVAQHTVHLAEYVQEAAIVEAIFSTDGSTLATIHQRPDARYLGVWNLNEPNSPAIRTAKLGEGGALSKPFILSPDGRLFTLRRGENNELALTDLATYRTIRLLKLGFPRNQIVAGTFSPDGRLLVVARRYFDHSRSSRNIHSLHLIDVASGASTIVKDIGHLNDVQWLAYSPNGATILVGVRKFNTKFHADFVSFEAKGDGAILFDARNLSLINEFGIDGYNPPYRSVTGGYVLPCGSVILQENHRVAVLALPAGVERLSLTPATDETFGGFVAADQSTLGTILVKKDKSSVRLVISHLDNDKHHFLRSHDLGADRPIAVGMSVNDEWLVVTANGLKRFPALPPSAAQAALALAEARELAKVGFVDEAYQLLSRALDIDWLGVKRRAVDILITHSPQLAGQLELKRWRLMQAEGDADAVWPLFGFGYLAVQAGHPQIVTPVIAQLQQIGDLGRALAGYLDALVLASRGDVDGGYRLAIAAKHTLNSKELGTLADRIKAHAQSWYPLYADRKKLAYLLGVEEGELPTPQLRQFPPKPYPGLTDKLYDPREVGAIAVEPDIPTPTRTNNTLDLKGRVLD